MDEARAEMRAEYRADMQAQGRVAAIDIPIMYWYEDVDYNNYAPAPGPGQAFLQINAADPCDTAGYRVETDSFWEDHLSSIAGNNSCFVARVTNLAETAAADFNAHVGYSGRWLGTYSDNVSRVQIHA